jgi:hypothetical protein
MGTHNLRPGDRVRVTRKNRLPGYLPGERGEVVAGPEAVAGSVLRYYLVAMEREFGPASAVFAADEIEPDG